MALSSITALGVLALILLGGLLNALGLGTSNQLEDDAFIFFRYVDNWVSGHGLTWNPGQEPVEGYSSFLYVALLAVPRLLGSDLVTASQAINVGLFLVTVALVFWLLRVEAGRFTPATVLGPLLVASSAQLGAFSRNGMESMLFAALIVLSLAVFLRRSERPVVLIGSGALFGLVTLTRPEGILVYLAALATVMWRNRTERRPLFPRTELLRLAGVLGVILPHLGFRLVYYGEPLPNTYYAKVGFRPDLVSRGFGGLVAFLATFRGAVAALALILWAMAPKDRDDRGHLFALLLAGWMAYIAFFLGLPRWGLWYTMPIDLFTMITLGWSLSRLLERLPIEAGWSRMGWVVALGLVVLGNVGSGVSRHQQMGTTFAMQLQDPPDRSVVNGFITIGKRFADIVRPGESMAVGACGAIPYYTGIETIDVLGLNDKHIARTPIEGPLSDAFGHEKGDGAYVLSRKPTYMIPLPVLTPRPNRSPAGFEKSFNQIFRLPEFQRDYEFDSVQVGEGQYLNYYRRKSPSEIQLPD
jgi:hypothetical protein